MKIELLFGAVLRCRWSFSAGIVGLCEAFPAPKGRSRGHRTIIFSVPFFCRRGGCYVSRETLTLAPDATPETSSNTPPTKTGVKYCFGPWFCYSQSKGCNDCM